MFGGCTLTALLCGLALIQSVASQTPIPARPLGKPNFPENAADFTTTLELANYFHYAGYNYVTCQEPKVVLEVFYDQ